MISQRAMRRRGLLRLMVLSMSGIALAACGTVAEPPPTSAPSRTPAPVAKPTAPTSAPVGAASTLASATVTPAASVAAQPRVGGTLRTGLAVDLPNLDVHGIQPSEFENLWMVY